MPTVEIGKRIIHANGAHDDTLAALMAAGRYRDAERLRKLMAARDTLRRLVIEAQVSDPNAGFFTPPRVEGMSKELHASMGETLLRFKADVEAYAHELVSEAIVNGDLMQVG